MSGQIQSAVKIVLRHCPISECNARGWRGTHRQTERDRQTATVNPGEQAGLCWGSFVRSLGSSVNEIKE